MKKTLLSLMLAISLFSCDDDEDEKIVPRDYGMKTFEADLKYSSTFDAELGYPVSTYAQQTYFSFGNEFDIVTITDEEDSWTDFNVFDSSSKEDISQAFADLTLADVLSLTYSDDVETIGRDWKNYDRASDVYTIATNKFYIVKLSSGDYYKLRILSFYGASKNDRVIKIEYQLLQ